MKTRLETAQNILESLEDIRPEYKGRTVVSVEELPEPLSVELTLDDSPEHKVKFTGLYARVILAQPNLEDEK